MGRGHERRREIGGRDAPGRFLLHLLSQAPRLRAQLSQDVADPGKVRLRLDQLRLSLAPPTLVTAHARHLLEQRTALLGPQGERLVDHALADEQEGVVRDVGGVE